VPSQKRKHTRLSRIVISPLHVIRRSES
jgi:hypothetical protein